MRQIYYVRADIYVEADSAEQAEAAVNGIDADDVIIIESGLAKSQPESEEEV